MSMARRRKKLTKKHLTWRLPPEHAGVTEEDKWESGKGAATSARYDKKWFERERVGQLLPAQAPVKYNRCKHSRVSHHCPPDLFDMRVRLEAERKARESQSRPVE
jgi:hypothetical protein